jgi:putative DNA primase/helicase
MSAQLDDAQPWEIPPDECYADEPAAQSAVVMPMKRAAQPAPKEPTTEEAKPRVTLRRAHEIVAEKRETNWLLYKILEAYVLAVIAGPRGTFKSFIVLDWLMRIALQGHTVVILSGEGAGLDRRIDAWMRTHAPDVDLTTLSILVLEHPLNLSLVADMEALREEFEKLSQPPAAVAVDTFSKFSAGIDENDNSEVAAYLSGLAEQIRETFRTTVVLVAHSGHGDAKRPRGASALMANPDAEYIVERPSPTAMTVTVSRERFKDGAALPPLAYEVRVVDLGRADRYGDPVTSLVLHSTDAMVEQPAKARGKNQELVLVALKEWHRAHPDASHISTLDIRAICTAQGVGRKRQPEVLTSFVNSRILSPSVGGYAFHGENL